jgi:hypothetical protein
MDDNPFSFFKSLLSKAFLFKDLCLWYYALRFYFLMFLSSKIFLNTKKPTYKALGG